MKIKRKEFERIQARLSQLEHLARTRFIIDGPSGKLCDMDFEEVAGSAHFRGPEDPVWLKIGQIELRIVPTTYATGYDEYLLSKYADSPWNVFNWVQIHD